MTEQNDLQEQSTPIPDPALRRLELLVGSWEIQGREHGPLGEIHGRVVFEWLAGGFFLVQRVDLNHGGRPVKALEVIGYDAASQSCISHCFDNTGNTLKYVWELDAQTLTIWGGYIGSPAHFKGTWNAERTSLAGRWQWPANATHNSVTGEWEWTDDGQIGGYESTMTRVAEA